MPIDPEMPTPAPDPEPPVAPSDFAAPVPAATEAIAAAAATGAVHAAATGRHHGPFHTHCENCGAELAGPWCHRCGQHDFEFHRSFWHVFLEALETIFHFEGKFFRNVVTLLFRPGRLSADFNTGKRASQMPPFRLYIFVSFVFFLLIFLGGDDSDLYRETDGPRKTVSVGGNPLAAGEWGAPWARATGQMKPEDWQDPARIRQAVAQAAAEAVKQNPSLGVAGSEAAAELARELEQAAANAKAVADKTAATPAATPPRGQGSELGHFLEEKGRRALEPGNRMRLVESFKRHLPHMLMFCLPFFALYTRVLFRKSGQVYLQHLVVALHFHTFIYIWVLCRNGWVGITDLPDWGLRGWVMFACNLWLVVYPFLMLRHLFRNSWPMTILKTFLLGAAYSLTLGLGFFVTAILLFASL